MPPTRGHGFYRTDDCNLHLIRNTLAPLARWKAADKEPDHPPVKLYVGHRTLERWTGTYRPVVPGSLWMWSHSLGKAPRLCLAVLPEGVRRPSC